MPTETPKETADEKAAREKREAEEAARAARIDAAKSVPAGDLTAVVEAKTEIAITQPIRFEQMLATMRFYFSDAGSKVPAQLRVTGSIADRFEDVPIIDLTGSDTTDVLTIAKRLYVLLTA